MSSLPRTTKGPSKSISSALAKVRRSFLYTVASFSTKMGHSSVSRSASFLRRTAVSLRHTTLASWTVATEESEAAGDGGPTIFCLRRDGETRAEGCREVYAREKSGRGPKGAKGGRERAKETTPPFRRWRS